MNYLFPLFKNYHAQGQSRGRFFSGPFTDIHLPNSWSRILFICFLTKLYLPSKAAFFSAFCKKIPCPVLWKLTYPWPSLRLWLFHKIYLPTKGELFIGFFKKLPCLGLKPRPNFHWLSYSLPTEAAFLVLFPKSTLPGFTEINLPVAQPKAMAFFQNLPHPSSLVQTTAPK